MTDPTIKEMGEKLRDTFKAIESITYGFAPHEIPETLPDTPCFVIFLGDVKYPENDVAHRLKITFKVQLFVVRGDQPTALATILKYIERTGDDSFEAALQGNYRLDGKVDWAKITANSGQSSLSWGEAPYLGTEFEVQCTARYT